jgi:hypothetical protein
VTLSDRNDRIQATAACRGVLRIPEPCRSRWIFVESLEGPNRLPTNVLLQIGRFPRDFICRFTPQEWLRTIIAVNLSGALIHVIL